MHQLTVLDIDLICKSVIDLPRQERYVRRSMSGRELMELGYSFIYGQAIDPEAHYAIDMPLAVNHVKVVADICAQHGMEALDSAVEQLRTARLTNGGTLLFVRN